MPDVIDITDFPDREIESEYERRFGSPEPQLSDWTSNDLLDELADRGNLPDDYTPQEEVIDLIAEAARTSPHAARAYELIRAESPQEVRSLREHQRLIAGRMGGLPL